MYIYIYMIHDEVRWSRPQRTMRAWSTAYAHAASRPSSSSPIKFKSD